MVDNLGHGNHFGSLGVDNFLLNLRYIWVKNFLETCVHNSLGGNMYLPVRVSSQIHNGIVVSMHVRSRPLSIYLIFLYKTTLNSGQNAFHSIGIRFDIRYQTVTILPHDEGMLLFLFQQNSEWNFQRVYIWRFSL